MTIEITQTSAATGEIRLDNLSPIRVFGTKEICETIGEEALQQAINARRCPGITGVALTPDAHIGHGVPVGCIMVSPSHIYPGPVGVDINCSMSLLQLDLPEESISDKRLRRAIINAITRRASTGYGRGRGSAAPRYSSELLEMAVALGATPEICSEFCIPQDWPQRCEDASRAGHNGTYDSLINRLDVIKYEIKKGLRDFKWFDSKLNQLGSYGGGNHFAECEIVRLSEEEKSAQVDDDHPSVAETFGLRDGCVAFLSHCGSRGFGNSLARNQFDLLKQKFELWGIPLPAGDPSLVYAPLGTKEADDYIDDMMLAANFATVNHLLLNAFVLQAFQEVIPGVKGNFVYHISHNVARKEIVDGHPVWVHRKGATRAFPAGHFALKDTEFEKTGHPILLPGDPMRGSAVMVALENAKDSFYSINHGAGRALGRRVARETLNQKAVDKDFNEADILVNCRQYPLDEAPAAYKDFDSVLHSVKEAGLAREVARLQAKFVIKDESKPDD